MFYKEYITIKSIVLHYVGNRLNQDGVKLSNNLLEIDDSVSNILMTYFLSPFKNLEYYTFFHESDLNLNEIYVYAKQIFKEPNSFLEESKKIAKHLYEQSRHPKIKNGEFYVVYFKDCIIDNITTDAIGLFKSENKDTFLKVYSSNSGYNLKSDEGININKLDKGCLIFNTKESGLTVSIVDNVNKSNDAQYWIDNFLHLKPRKDEYHNTQTVLSLCRDFVTTELSEKFNISKIEQADILNKSVSFFKEKSSFNIDNFAIEVIGKPELIADFKNYKEKVLEEQEVTIDDNFDISIQAVKKQAKSFKAVIKLDQNFDIHIHNNSNLLEKGQDANGRKFYKIYYLQEN